MNNHDQVIGFVLFGILVIGLIVWHFYRSRSVLQQWADDHGFEIIRSEHRHLFRGPFFWTTSRGQTVYFVSVRDKKGKVRTGWVRCGGWLLGLMTDETEVQWEDKE